MEKRQPPPVTTLKPCFKRVLLKLSGEVFGGEQGFGFDYAVIRQLATQIVKLKRAGVQVGIVIGGGNIFRGAPNAPEGMDRVVADHMGMLATLINCLAMQDALEREGADTRVLSAIEIRAIAESHIKRRVDRHLEKGRIVLFAAGTGNPFFTTDTAASLRASEISAQVLIKGTKVDGVYDRDPMKDEHAVRYETLTYDQALRENLRVMDSTALAFCRENRMPILVLNIREKETLVRAVVGGERVGTWIQRTGTDNP